MPLYTYECDNCGFRSEELFSFSERVTVEVTCTECGEEMNRIPDAPNLGKPAFQMGAVLSNGEQIAGHFGKSAKKKR